MGYRFSTAAMCFTTSGCFRASVRLGVQGILKGMMTLQMSAPPSFPLIVTWVYALIGVVSDTLVPFMIVVSVGLISAPLFEIHVEAEEDCEEGAEIEKRKPFLVAPESFAGFDLAIEFSEIVTIISKSHDVFLEK